MSDRWDLLVSRYLDGAATSEDVQELDERLKSDAGARRRFLLMADQEATIRDAVTAQGQRDDFVCRVARRRRPSPGRHGAPPSGTWTWVAAAAAILVAVAILFAARPSPKTVLPQPSVAREEPAVVPMPEPERPRDLTPEVPRLPLPASPEKAVAPEPPSLPGPKPPVPVVPVPAPAPPREERKTVPDAAPVVPSLRVAHVDGEVEGALKPPFAWKEGAALAVSARAAGVTLENGTRLALAPGTELRLTTAQPPAIRLQRGEVTCSVVPAPAGSKVPALTVLTEAAEARVLGTHFSVALEGDATRVLVDEGAVRVSRRGDAKSLTLRAGQHVSIGPGLPFAAKIRPPNLLLDPGFEAGGRGWKGFEGRPPAFGPEVRVVPSSGRRGKVALQISDPFQGNLCQGVAVEAGAVYEVEGWVKIPGAGAWGMTVVWLDETGNWKSWVRADDIGQFAGSREWTRWSGRFTAPARAKTGWIVLFPVQPGTVLLDDFHFGLISR